MCESLRDLIKTNQTPILDPYRNCIDCDEEVHDTLRKISNMLHESQDYMLREDDDGRPVEFTNWYYD